jgi:hypothetical protein
MAFPSNTSWIFDRRLLRGLGSNGSSSFIGETFCLDFMGWSGCHGETRWTKWTTMTDDGENSKDYVWYNLTESYMILHDHVYKCQNYCIGGIEWLTQQDPNHSKIPIPACCSEADSSWAQVQNTQYWRSGEIITHRENVYVSLDCHVWLCLQIW